MDMLTLECFGNTISLGLSEDEERPIGLQFEWPAKEGGRSIRRFEYFSPTEVLWLLEGLHTLLQHYLKQCSFCGLGEDDVRAFYSLEGAAVRICDGCIAEAAVTVQAALIAAPEDETDPE